MNKRYWITFFIFWAVTLCLLIMFNNWLIFVVFNGHPLAWLIILDCCAHGFYSIRVFDWVLHWIASNRSWGNHD